MVVRITLGIHLSKQHRQHLEDALKLYISSLSPSPPSGAIMMSFVPVAMDGIESDQLYIIVVTIFTSKIDAKFSFKSRFTFDHKRCLALVSSHAQVVVPPCTVLYSKCEEMYIHCKHAIKNDQKTLILTASDAAAVILARKLASHLSPHHVPSSIVGYRLPDDDNTTIESLLTVSTYGTCACMCIIDNRVFCT